MPDLPNRTLFRDRLQQAILSARRENGPGALLLLDLDRFKEINDTFGHHYGDLLLQQIGPRLRSELRESDTVARLGGDEFAVLLPSTDGPRAMRVASKLARAVEQPFSLNEHRFHIGTSVGVALFPRHSDDLAALLREADVAMYVAKRTDQDCMLYSVELDENTPARLLLIGDLRQAIASDQLLLYYQPKVSLKTGEVKQVEALVRWYHPRLGLLPPSEFIPLAEQSGLMKPLTLWVLKRALRQCQTWHQSGLQVTVAVNLSASSLHDPQLVDAIMKLLRSYAIPPSLLELEVTEGAIMFDSSRCRDMLARLHEMGVRISIDDFGTGHSSLSYLKQLPVDQIKIDKTFVLDMAANEDDAFIAQSVIDLGHHLGLEVLAEGIENRETWELLASMGCDLAQGHHVSRPVPAEEVLGWFESSGPSLSLYRPSFFQLGAGMGGITGFPISTVIRACSVSGTLRYPDFQRLPL